MNLLNLDFNESNIIISFKCITDKENFIILLKRYFEYIKKEKIFDEYLIIMENYIIIKKEAHGKLKKPILKISDFFEKSERKIKAENLICDIVQIKYNLL